MTVVADFLPALMITFFSVSCTTAACPTTGGGVASTTAVSYTHLGEVVWNKMINSTKSTDNEERDDNQTTFHAFVSFPPFHLYNRYHNPQAHNVLPATAATVMIIASSPRVCKPLIIDSLPPTSIPRRKRRIHIRRVIILCIHDSLLLRNK